MKLYCVSSDSQSVRHQDHKQSQWAVMPPKVLYFSRKSLTVNSLFNNFLAHIQNTLPYITLSSIYLFHLSKSLNQTDSVFIREKHMAANALL